MRNRTKSALATAGYSTNFETSALALLVDYAAQNSGIEPGNYYDYRDPNKQALRDGRRAFAQESRSIGADWRRVKAALIQCAIDGVTDADVIAAAPRAFSGRLEWVPPFSAEVPQWAVGHESELAAAGRALEANGQIGHWSYCTGQYWPTEYRKAVASVLESASHEKRRSRPPEIGLPQSFGELERLNKKNGGCWFEAATMRFFGTRLEGGIIAGHYFITSEQPPHGPRVFSVRSFDDKGSIDTVGEFAKAATKEKAMANLREHLKIANQQAA